MKSSNRFTKICVLSVITYKENYDEDFYIKIRYLVNEVQPKLQELIFYLMLFFCVLSIFWSIWLILMILKFVEEK